MCKRISSILLCLAMVLCLLPAAASAETAPYTITVTDVTVPVEGAKADFSFSIPENNNYRKEITSNGNVSAWMEYDTKPTDLAHDDATVYYENSGLTFKGGKYYVFSAWLEPVNGTFPSGITATMNGKAADDIWAGSTQLNVYGLFYCPSASEPISFVEVTGVTAPVIGELADFSYDIPDGVYYRRETGSTGRYSAWTECDTKPTDLSHTGGTVYYQGSGLTFKGGKYYVFSAWLEPTTSTFASDLTATLNGKPADDIWMLSKQLHIYTLFYCQPNTFSLVTQVDGGNGSVSQGDTDIPVGTSKTVTFSPNEGYEIDKVTVNGVETAVADNTLDIQIHEDTTVIVTYKEIPHTHSATGTNAANCKEPAVCDSCGESFGETDPAKHKTPDGFRYISQSETVHYAYYTCCDTCYTNDDGPVELAHVYADDADLTCNDCGYERAHHCSSPVLVQGTAPTCTKPGTKDSYRCACGLVYLDEACQTPVESDADLKIAAAGHKDENSDEKCDVCSASLAGPALTPDTGDTAGPVMWAALVSLSAGAILVMIYWSKRRNYAQ